MTYETVSLSKLMLDGTNPRLHEHFADQAAVLESMLKDSALGPKILDLAEDISEHGQNPAEQLLVTSEGAGSPGEYIVLDGNRRIAAMKLLLTPRLGEEVLSASQMKRLRQWSTKMTVSIVSASVVVFPTRKSADHWIELRHGEGNAGAAVIAWDTSAKRKWGGRHSPVKPFLTQLTDFLDRMGVMPEWFAKSPGRFPITTLERMLLSKEARMKFGISEGDDGSLMLHNHEDAVAAGFRRLIDDLTATDRADRVTVTDLKTKEQRETYVKDRLSLPKAKSKLPKPVPAARVSGNGNGKDGVAGARSRAQRGVKPLRKQSTLFGAGFSLAIDNQRIREVENDLKRLKVDDFPSTAAVMLRVFIELSVDSYVRRNRLMTKSQVDDYRTGLDKKIEATVKHLKDEAGWTSKDEIPLKQLRKSGKTFDPGLEMLHAYVHDGNVIPQSSDLKAFGASLRPFLTALWP